MATDTVISPNFAVSLTGNQPAAETAAPIFPAPALANAFKIARGLISAGQLDGACTVLRQLIDSAPSYDEPWLQLLALEPEPGEEVELLAAFLAHHPNHRFADAFRARLQDMRIVAMLGQSMGNTGMDVDSVPQAMRLGDYLIMREWVTLDQVEDALAEQRRLRAQGVDLRLGTLLLMQGHVGPAQLATAFAEASGSGFGELGNYLVRSSALTALQVGEALARQAAMAAEIDREYLAKLAAYRKRGSFLGLRSAPQRKPVPRLGEVLVSMGLLTSSQVERLMSERHSVFHASFS